MLLIQLVAAAVLTKGVDMRILDGSPEAYAIDAFVGHTYVEHVYAWRRIDGQRVVRDDGIALFDFVSIERS